MNRNTFSFSRLLSAALLVSLTTVIAAGCKKDKQAPPATAPLIKTAALTNVTSSSVTAGGSIVSDNGDTVTKSGVVWSKTNATPTLSDTVVTATATTGAFTVNISGLDLSNTYYFRAFATNSVGTGYGDVVAIGAGSDTSKVRFTYNGQEVAYGIIISAVSGKKWLDRNLGASQAATAFDDYKAYGDLFQWGRPADGHQLMNWTASDAGTPVNGTTTTMPTSDIPGNSNFIIPPYALPLDWRSDNNSKRWVTIPQGPCPPGWHVPTLAEWLAEVSKTVGGGTANSGGMTNYNTAYSQLKLTVAGVRRVDGPGTVNFYQVGHSGTYWSTTEEIAPSGVTKASSFNPGPDFIMTDGEYKSQGLSVRCIKD